MFWRKKSEDGEQRLYWTSELNQSVDLLGSVPWHTVNTKQRLVKTAREVEYGLHSEEPEEPREWAILGCRDVRYFTNTTCITLSETSISQQNEKRQKKSSEIMQFLGQPMGTLIPVKELGLQRMWSAIEWAFFCHCGQGMPMVTQEGKHQDGLCCLKWTSHVCMFSIFTLLYFQGNRSYIQPLPFPITINIRKSWKL